MGEKMFLSNSFIYIVGVFLNQGVNFLTLLILARLLSPDNYALISLYGIFVNVCLAFISLQGSASVNNALIEYGEEKLGSYVFSISLLTFLVSAVTILVVLVFNRALESFVGLPTFVILMIVIQATISSFALLQLDTNRVLKKAATAVFWSSAIPVLRIGLSILLVLFVFDRGYLGDVYGFFIAGVVIGLIAIGKTVYDSGVIGKTAHDSKPKFRLSYIKFCLPITIPIIFHAVSNLILTATDKIMLDMMLGGHEMGIYSFIFNISLVPTGIWFAINSAWGVEYFERLSKNDVDSIRALTYTYIKYIFCVYVIVLLVLPEAIQLVAAEEYFPGIVYSPIIVAGGFMTFLYTICSIHQTYSKRTVFIPIATLVSAAANVGLNFLLIPIYGAFGAAIAIIISLSILFLAHFLFSGIVIGNFPIKFLRMAIPAAIVACVAVFVYVFIDYTWIRLIPAAIFGTFSLISFLRFVKAETGSH